MTQQATPGVYREDEFQNVPVALPTGVPAFLGYTARQNSLGEAVPLETPLLLTRAMQFEQQIGSRAPGSYLPQAVQGFFQNGGDHCYVVSLDDQKAPVSALQQGLAALAPLDGLDLVCAPDIMRSGADGSVSIKDANAMQVAVLEHCDRCGDRFAILDCYPGLDSQGVLVQRQGLNSPNGALYYPWIQVQDNLPAVRRFIPPCGHIAGVYARSDQNTGVHKAPANEPLENVLDLEVNLTDAGQADLNPFNVNGLRAFPGRGIRVWGARTLSTDPAWRYINVRRLFLTAGRWIERNMPQMAFEPNTPRLWGQIERELTTYFEDLFRKGALQGSTPQDAFYVKCSADTNPSAQIDAGMVITEIGLAPTVPSEFVIVRIVHSASGVTITGPIRPF